MAKKKLVYIKWVDSQIASCSWVHVNEIEPVIAVVETVGFKIKENKKTITVAGSFSDKGDSYDQVAQVITIPKCCIKKMKLF